MKKYILLIGGCCLSLSVFAEKPSNDWTIALSQTQTNKNNIGKPARFFYTDPSGGESSYLTDFGVDVISPGSNPGGFNYNWYFSAEIHKNTLIDKKQDTRSVSIALGGNKKIPIFDSANVIYSLKYQDDRVDNKESYYFEANYSLVNRTLRSAPIREGAINNVAWYALSTYSDNSFGMTYIEPTIGLQYHDIQSAPAGDVTGDRIRFKGQLEFEFIPKFDTNIAFNYTYRIWDTLTNDKRLDAFADSENYREYALRYTLGESSEDDTASYKYGLLFSHVNGANPDVGLADQEYNQAGFEVKYSY